jgi:hypothetical protein
VRALAEFGDLPENVDLIVLQQLPHSTRQNLIEVRAALQRVSTRAAVVARRAFARIEPSSLLVLGRGLQSNICPLLNGFSVAFARF